MGGAANSLAARRCTPLTLGVGLIYALCGIAGRARANGDCVESCRSKVLGASATGGAPGQVVCEIVPEESYAHCPADGSAPILDLDTGACWWASSAVPVGHRCCNLGVEPRCGLPPTPEPWQLWIVSPSPPCARRASRPLTAPLLCLRRSASCTAASPPGSPSRGAAGSGISAPSATTSTRTPKMFGRSLTATMTRGRIRSGARWRRGTPSRHRAAAGARAPGGTSRPRRTPRWAGTRR